MPSLTPYFSLNFEVWIKSFMIYATHSSAKEQCVCECYGKKAHFFLGFFSQPVFQQNAFFRHLHMHCCLTILLLIYSYFFSSLECLLFQHQIACLNFSCFLCIAVCFQHLQFLWHKPLAQLHDCMVLNMFFFVFCLWILSPVLNIVYSFHSDKLKHLQEELDSERNRRDSLRHGGLTSKSKGKRENTNG